MATLHRMPVALTNPESHNVWIYARVSADKRKGRSVRQQTEACREWCARDRLPIGNELKDNDVSASRFAKGQRDDWELLKDGIRHKKMTIVMYWEASRATRDLMAYSELRDLCVRNDVYLAYGGKVYDMDDDDDRYITGLDILNSEKEAAQTSKRVKRDMSSSALAGKPTGRIPYGYARSYDPQTGESIQSPDPVKAELIKEAAARFLSGESTRAIAQDWNRRGIPAPHASSQFGWRLEQVKRILVNPAVNAQRVHQGEIIGRAVWEPILDDVTYAKVLARFADPSRKTTRARETAKLLTGVARCSVCGGPVGYAPQKGVDRKVRNTYRCRYNNCTTRDMNQLETYVTATLFEWIHERGIADQVESDDAAINANRERIIKLRTKLDDITAEFTNPDSDMSASRFATIERDLRAQIHECERAIRTTNVPTAALDLAMSDEPERLWDELTVEQRREIIRSLFDVTIHPIKVRGGRKFDPSCVTIARR